MVSRRASDPPALATRTSLRVGGTPERFYEPATHEEAGDVLRRLHVEGVPVRILGGGYNLLVGDLVLTGAIISTRQLRTFTTFPDWVEAGAGYSFPRLVREAIDLRIPGLPGCPGIPGSVGGVVFMNAGGRHGSVKDALIGVRGFDMAGVPFERRIRDGDLSYRRSSLGGHLVTQAIFRRDRHLEPAMLKDLHEQAWAWKRASQPLSQASAGCIFKNPDGATGPRSAGRLIDEAGLKGHRVGGAMVSEQHANFIVNVGEATSDDVHALIREIQARVRSHHGVDLELEVQVWG